MIDSKSCQSGKLGDGSLWALMLTLSVTDVNIGRAMGIQFLWKLKVMHEFLIGVAIGRNTISGPSLACVLWKGLEKWRRGKRKIIGHVVCNDFVFASVFACVEHMFISLNLVLINQLNGP